MAELGKWTVKLKSKLDEAEVNVYARSREHACEVGWEAAKLIGMKGTPHTITARLATPRDLGCVPMAAKPIRKTISR